MQNNYTVFGKTPEQAWRSAINFVRTNGNKILDEHGVWNIEVENLQIVVEKPLEGWPIEGSGWTMPALREYAMQFFSPDPAGFEYTYGERLPEQFAEILGVMKDQTPSLWKNIQQRIMGAMEADILNSRRFTIPLLKQSDLLKKHAPCMVAVSFLIRGEKINTTAYFRSHDIFRVWLKKWRL